MSFQRVHQSTLKNAQTSWSTSGFAPSSISTQSVPTQEEIENQAFEQDKFEATGLQIKEKHGTITPVEQERLGILQAKMDSFWVQRLERTSSRTNLLEVLIRNSQATSTTPNIQHQTIRPIAQSQRISPVSRNIQLAASQSNTPTQELNYTPASQEINYTPGEDEASEMGQEALQTVGYEKIIETALQAGFLRVKNPNEEPTEIQAKLQASQDLILRQTAEAAAWTVFTRYAVAAGVASQVDSPAPGPGDVVAIGILIVGLAAAGYVLMASHGNVADTGIMEEVQRLIDAARAAGQALTICEALAQLMAAAERARDSAKIQRIKATQKAKGCRHSRHS